MLFFRGGVSARAGKLYGCLTGLGPLAMLCKLGGLMAGDGIMAGCEPAWGKAPLIDADGSVLGIYWVGAVRTF